MARTPDPHPDDRAARLALIAQLRTIREQAGLSRTDLAQHLGITYATIAQRETKGGNQLIHTTQAHARALGVRVVMTPQLDPGLPEHPTTAVLRAMADGDPDPGMADSYHRSVVLHTMVAHRRWLCVSARAFAERLGLARGAGGLSEMEAETHPPLLSTYQRYARALGGWLELDLQPLAQPITRRP